MNLSYRRGGRRVRFVSVMLTALLLANLMPPTSVQAGTLANTGAPQGFILKSVATGLDTPTVAQFTPDGRIFVGQKNGVIKVVKNGQVLAQPLYTTLKVNDYVDRGLLGMVIDPNFTANGYVYILFTYDTPTAEDGIKNGRLIRITVSGDKAVVGSEFTVLGKTVGTAAKPSCDNYPLNTDCIPADYLSHGPDSLAFGPDGKLYMSIGESSNYDQTDTKAFRAQDLDSIAGKVLRINTDGTGPADNPYFDGNPNSVRSKVYAYGFRNPFRMSIRQDGLVMVGDVGWNFWEEINAVVPGGNYGWPCFEGNEQQNGVGDNDNKYKDLAACKQMYQNLPATLKSPTLTYPHPPASAVVGGVFYTGNNYPAQYKNRYFYGDYVKNQISSFALNSSNVVVAGSNQLFASNAAGPVNFFNGLDGDLYFVGILDGSIYHIAYTTTNNAPNAVASADKTFGGAPLTVNFTSSGSSDPENDPLSYQWDFGDGTIKSNDANPVHVYGANGIYSATLTVTDTFNNKDSKTVDIHVGQTPPTLTISSPSDSIVAATGQQINFSGSAVDQIDGNLPGSKLSWQVDILHCPLSACHIHTMLTASGTSGSFNFPAHDGNYYVQITLRASNSVGLTSTKYITVYPQGQKITHGLQLDGVNDYASANNPNDFKLQQFTAEAMVRTFSTDSGGSEIMSMGNNWMLRIEPGGSLMTSFNNAGTWQVLSAPNVIATDGLWHHVAFTKTSTELKLFFDGKQVAKAANNKIIDYVYGGDFLIGRHGDDDDNYSFNGTIDEVRVWANPRSDADILAYQSSQLSNDGQGSIMAYYTMEEGTGGTSADVGPLKAHNVTLVNGAAWTVGAPLADVVAPPPPVAVNNGLTVNGTIGKATVKGAGAFDLQNMSLESWSKTSTVGTGGGEVISNGNNYGIRIRPNGNPVFFMRTGTNAWSEFAVTGMNLKDNMWHHIAVTKDATSVRIYTDGILRKTFANSKAISYVSNKTFTVGKHSENDPAYALTGTVDEVRIWNTTRTAAQISANWQKELAAQTGLIGYWQFNETSGTTAADVSGKSHPLTLSTGTSRGIGFPKL